MHDVSEGNLSHGYWRGPPTKDCHRLYMTIMGGVQFKGTTNRVLLATRE